MRKLLSRPWVVALLVVAAVVLVAQSLLDRPQQRPRGVAVEPVFEETEESPLTPARGAASLAEALDGLSLPDQLPDPFAPRRERVTEDADEGVDTVPAHIDAVLLSAIWEQDGSAYVLLNGAICRAGDTVGRITVASVEREGVWLAHWKGRDFVRLGQKFTLVTPAAAAAKPRTATHEG